jgi:phage terminase small subunit
MNEQTRIKIPPPDHLSPGSKELWNQIVEEYEIDAPASLILVAAFEARDRREEARAALSRDGAVILDRFQRPKGSPWVVIEATAAATLLKCFRALGFDQEPRPPKKPTEDGL